MPRGDGTGPRGQGFQTGRNAGYCSGFDQPAYANDGVPRQRLAHRSGCGNNQSRKRNNGKRGGRKRRR